MRAPKDAHFFCALVKILHEKTAKYIYTTCFNKIAQVVFL